MAFATELVALKLWNHLHVALERRTKHRRLKQLIGLIKAIEQLRKLVVAGNRFSYDLQLIANGRKISKIGSKGKRSFPYML
ncbi:hypothetical protein CDL15_Pgr018724 [Punica granatum]|uniref:Uncharacterized protein n=1 Tax=Punica granatum TaxID=22663 RepID=A0A218VV02_PUNGR|nr:hypothetical protein CDL15_Pgr018724 [Punica granatum]